jgi:Gpi18-like mannosyltransferase
VNVPPVVAVLAVLAGIRRALGVVGDVPFAWLIIKLVPIATDLIAAALIFRLAKPRIGDKAALAFSLIFAFNPAAIVNSAAWGQVDSVLALCLAATLIWASEGRWASALPMYVISVLIKPQALMFGPLGLFMLIADLIRNTCQMIFVKSFRY